MIFEPGKQITVQELYDLAQKISAPTWTGRGNVCQAHHMGEAKRLLKILAEGVPLTKDPQSEYPHNNIGRSSISCSR